jgi:glutathione peroxidase
VHNITRRTALLATGAAVLAPRARAASTTRAWDFKFQSIDEGVLDFADYKGKIILAVNTASFCGFTYQYEGLEKLYAATKDKGLEVIGFPSQDFNQESGKNATIKDFCEATFGVQFPMTGLVHVKGPNADPFYKWVKAEQDGWEPNWNFNKVLIGRDGRIIDTFGSLDEPQGRTLTKALSKAMAVAA